MISSKVNKTNIKNGYILSKTIYERGFKKYQEGKTKFNFSYSFCFNMNIWEHKKKSVTGNKKKIYKIDKLKYKRKIK